MTTGNKQRAVRRSKILTFAQSHEELRPIADAGADVVQLTVEHGVPPSGKQAAREAVLSALSDVDWGPSERWVKINSPASGFIADDVDVLTEGRPDAFIIAKGSGPEDVRTAAGLIGEAERKHGLPAGSVRMCASIERISALSRVEEVATAHPRLISLQVGPIDLGVEYGYRLDRTGPSWETLYAKSRSILAARMAGIEIGDAPYFLAGDLDGALRSTLFSIQLGFTHKACRLPSEVPVINRAFDMAADFVDRALAEEH